MNRTINVTVNGASSSHEVEPRLLLIDYLRETIGLTGSHVGCETSLCGACTIELNGKAIKSCSIFAVQADGAKIVTIEGLAGAEGKLHPIHAFAGQSSGVKGVGEAGTIGSTPAMVNSVVDALSPLGIRHTDMPLMAEKIWKLVRGAAA